MTRFEINPAATLGGDTIYSDNAVRYSISPDMSGLALANWMKDLESLGVNTGILNLDPARLLTGTPVISDGNGPVFPGGDWQSYLTDIDLPPADITKKMQKLINGTADDGYADGIRNRIANYAYTPQERDESHIQFLQQLQALKNSGQIAGTVQFVLNQRLWFIKKQNTDAPPTYYNDSERAELEAQFAADMAGMINAAKAQGLDSWITGIRLEEHANTDMNQVLPIFVDLATLVNNQTGGWLQSHRMIGNGGGWGADFKGVNSVTCPAAADPKNAAYDNTYQFTCAAGSSFDFFGLMSKQTAGFAFGYKFMEFNNVYYYNQAENFINGVMAVYCKKFLDGCDPHAVTSDNWKAFLSDDVNGLGFSDLVSLIQKNTANYPAYANVVFVGDSTDSLFEILDSSPNKAPCASTSEPSCMMTALSQLFSEAASQNPGAWEGKLMVDGHDNPTNLAKYSAGDVTDDGRNLRFVDFDDIQFTPASPTNTLQTSTYGYWQCWPALPPCLAQLSSAP